MNNSAPRPIANKLPVFNRPEAIRLSMSTLLQAIVTEGQMYGVEEAVRLSLVALFCRGHVLLEGNPGLGKTELVKALHQQLGFPWKRIQFTPDLMPADITGSLQPDPANPSGALAFAPGPVFTSLLLADEINRATPKTQAAMLEAMAEKQVTVAGRRHALPADDLPDAPFMVFATQNPIDQEGTYELPEAQADRFMFKLLMRPPNAETLSRILTKTAGRVRAVEAVAGSAKVGGEAGPRGKDPTHPAERAHSYHEGAGPATANPEAGLRFKDLTYPDERIQGYHDVLGAVRDLGHAHLLELHITNLVAATNGQWSELRDLRGEPKSQQAKRERLQACLEFGLGPRAGTALLLGSKAWGTLFGTTVEADASDLVRVLCPVLRHRLRLHYNWRETFAQACPGASEKAGIDEFVWELADACVPREKGVYAHDWEQQLRIARVA